MAELDDNNFCTNTVKELGDGRFTASVSTDSLGRELEAHRCEYCGKVKPVRVWNGTENGRESYNVLLHDYICQKDGKRYWLCNDCAADMENKSNGKDV